jgi:hypothetical protein
MKQTLLSRLILAGLAGAALSAAHAGQIQSSSVSIARESITTDVQSVIAPSIAYRFAGDVDARVQAQTFQIQFILADGAWGTLPGSFANTISVSDGVSGVIQEQSAAAPTSGTNASYTVVATGVDAATKTVWATITVNQGAAALIKQPLFSMNVTSNNVNGILAGAGNVAGGRAPVTGLKAVTGDLVNDYNATPSLCEAVKTLAVSFKHFVALNAPASLATVTTATADEHVRTGHTNTATLMTFPTNVKVSVVTSAGGVGLTPGGNLAFQQNGAAGAFISGTLANLGSVSLVQNATGYDSNLAKEYKLANGGAGVQGIAIAASNAGALEVSSVKVTVAATQGFVVNGTLALNTNANCGAGTALTGTASVAITSANAAGPIDLVIDSLQVNAALGAATGTAPVHVCYTTAGLLTVPSSVFSAVARVVKAAAGAGFNEQDNICKGNFQSLGGGLKIDVRNYASSSETGGYMSVLRFINNSDSAPADVWAQFVHQNGNLGNWAKLADLPVRGAVNMTAKQIDAKLAAGSVATAAVGTAAAVAQAATATTSDTAPRLRITSTTGKSLRVQNYLFNSATNQILEASGQQGVDFEISTNRAPANEGQYQDQDANSGLNLAK